MPAPLSIIIPTLNAANDIGPCLAALTEGLGAGLVRELIITDGGSDDDIMAVADEAGAVFLTGKPGRGAQLSRAALASRGRWFLFLHADTVLAENWSDAVLRHLQENPDKAGYFDLRFDAKGIKSRLVAGWANLRSRLFGLPYGDQGLLISAQLYKNIGGYQSIPLMEDVDIARRLSKRLAPLNHVVVTSAIRYQRDGWFARGWRNLSTVALYYAGRSPEKLAKRYLR